MEIRTVLEIDVSKATSNVAVLVNSKSVDEFKIDNDIIGFNRLRDTIDHFKDAEVVFEATSVYSRRLAYFLRVNKIPYTQLNPLQASKDLDGLRKNKTDKMDAFHLAETQFRLNREKTFIEKPVYYKLLDDNRFYQENVSDLVREKNRLHRILQLTFPEIEGVMSEPTGVTYWNLVKEFPVPTFVKKFNIDQLKAIVMECGNNHITFEDRNKIATKLMTFASKSVTSVESDSDVIDQVRYRASRLKEIDKVKKETIKKMANLAKDLPEFKILLSIPGISIITAVSLIAELGDIRRFHSTNQLNAFVGIDLRHYESGNYTASDRISKRGNPYARKILYNTIRDMVSVAPKHPSHINDYYQNKKQPSPRGMKKIAIASMGRLLRTIYHLVFKNEIYDYKIASRTIY